MKVLIMNTLNGATNTVAENEAPQWASSTSYAKGARCMYQHYIYTSLIDANRGNVPANTHSGVNAKWEKGSVSNHWAMYDNIINTQTVTAEGVETIVATMPFYRATGFACFRLDCDSMTARAYDVDASVPYWEQRYELLRDRRSRWRYRYEAASWRKDVIETAIPGLTIRGRLELIFTRLGGKCAVGRVVAGGVHYIGQTQFGAEPSVKSYSTVTEDVFGNTTITERYFTKNVRAEVYVHPLDVDARYEFLKSIINKPAVWICDNEDLNTTFECLLTYGYLRAVSANIKAPNEAYFPIEIMGMI